VSFIKNIEGDFFAKFSWYVSDYLTLIEEVQYTDQGIGVYRIPLTANTAYDSVCIQVFKAAVPGTPGTPETEDLLEDFPPMEDWVNSGTGGNWTVSNTPSYSGLGHSGSLRYTSNTLIDNLYPFVAGVSYRMTGTYTKVHTSGSETFRTLILAANDNTGAAIFQTNLLLATGDTSGQIELSFVATSLVKGAYFHYQNGAADNIEVTINTFEVYQIIPAVPPGPAQDAFVITEEICIDILDTCEAAEGFTEEDRRLLEDGDYRLLE
jgi:hypothetical protein